MEEKIPFGEEHPRERRKRIQESPNDNASKRQQTKIEKKVSH